MWERETSQGTGLQGCGPYLQRVWQERTLQKRFACRVNTLHTLWRHHRPLQQGLEPVNPYISMMRDSPVYTYMLSVPHANKHLIRFPVTIEPMALRRKGTHMDSSLSTPSVLLKADTGADVNLMNRKTFDQLFDSKVLRPPPIRMENYGNSTVKVLGMFHAFLRWKDRVYRQLFYVTDCDRSPNFLSRDASYTLGVLKPCYMVERTPSAQQHLAPKTSLHQKMKGSNEKLSNDSKKQSIISQSQLKNHPLMKQDILHVYCDVFTRIGKFPGTPYKFQLKENAKPARHAPRKVPIHLQDAFHSEI